MGLREKWGCLCLVLCMIVGFGYEVRGCFEDEKQALLQLKSVFKYGENYLTSWTSDCYCHGWEGVTCGPNGRLITLSLPPNYDHPSLNVEFNASILLPFRDLRELYLSGSIKLSSSLTKLEILDLSQNYLSSSILQNLSGFHSLRSLSLSDNRIKGCVQLNDFEALKNLEELDLSWNNITSFLNQNGLPKLQFLDLNGNEELGNNSLSLGSALPSLKYLYIGNTGLTGQIELKEIEAFKRLEELDLSRNAITGFVNYRGSTGNNNSPSLESASPSLKYLYLRSTGLTGQIQIKEMEAFKSLEKLDLSGNSITGFVIYKGLPKLQFLDLSENEELGNNSLSLGRALPSLKHLYLGNTGLTGQIELKEIDAFKCLEELDLSGNSVTSFVNRKGCGQMQKLQKLDISWNALRTLPSWWGNLSSLQTLKIARNQITGNIASTPLVHLHSLEYLYMGNNKIQIPDSFKAFQNLTKLKYLYAHSNQVIVDNSSERDFRPSVHSHGLQLQVLDLSYCEATTYPSFLHHQHDLRGVHLSSNPMEGNFPKGLLENNLQLELLLMRNNSLTGHLQLPLFAHTHLGILDITHNNLHGHIPPNISATFPRLRELYMSENGFSGDIPSGLFDIESLMLLSLSSNHLSGGFRNSTKNHLHGQLRMLILSHNKFEGELPPLYGFPSLEVLDLQGNNFSGSIKPNMFSTSLEVLNLSNNSLQGPIPKDFCTLDNLKQLDLSYNMLNGSVQSCLFNFSSIELLSLSNNKLSGGINYTFEYSYSWLGTLDLSHNDLVGEVPAFIWNFVHLDVLILKGNQFHGLIPIQLCQLGQLSILDLSNNNLSGQIPSCLSNMAFDGTIPGWSYDLTESTLYGNLVQLGIDAIAYDVEASLAFTTKSMSYIYKGATLNFMSGMDLSSNRLSGEIPQGIGNLSSMCALNLSHNNLYGSIPAYFSNLKNIESLDLSYNSLNGSIPAELSELYNLEVFKVAYNNLSGQVPFTAQFGTFDASDYEGNPLLCGSPILKSCTPAGELPPIEPNDVKKEEEEERWIDMEAFYMSLAASSVTMFLAVVVIFWINPFWCNLLFYLAKLCVLSTYYFIEDTCRGLRGVRSV